MVCNLLGFFWSLTMVSLRSIIVVVLRTKDSFLYISDWYIMIWMHHSLFHIHESMDTGIVLNFWLLWRKLVWTFTYGCLCEHTFPFAGIHDQEWNCWIVQWLRVQLWKKLPNCFLERLYQCTPPPALYERPDFSASCLASVVSLFCEMTFNKMYEYLKYTALWFDIHIHSEMISTVKWINISPHMVIICVCVCVCDKREIYSPSKFPATQ